MTTDPALRIAEAMLTPDDPDRDAIVAWLRRRPDLTAHADDPAAARAAVIAAIVAELRAAVAAITGRADRAA